jgi:hypothetical protein
MLLRSVGNVSSIFVLYRLWIEQPLRLSALRPMNGRIRGMSGEFPVVELSLTCGG